MTAPKTKKEKLFEEYLSNSKIFVVDSSGVSRSRILRALKDFGSPDNLVQGFGKYDDALLALAAEKPKLILSEYKIGKMSGFDLLKAFKEGDGNKKDSMFVLITSNSSQSLVAKAAEEDIDSFILKPYTQEVLQTTLMNAIVEKIYPSPYIKTIEDGKELLFAGKPTEALAEFEKAKTMHPRPSLACFYAGQAKYMEKSLSDASGKYKEGLTYNKIHYKCLVSLFDVFYEMKQYDDAYDIVKTIAEYFPANPERLTTVLRLAVMTNNFKDIERYYEIFLALEMRTPELIKYVCAGLIVCGKYFFNNNMYDKALQMFEKVGITAYDSPKFLRIAIEGLIEKGYAAEAEKFLTRFEGDHKTTDDYLISEYLVADRNMDAFDSIKKGVELIKIGKDSYCIYLTLIRRHIEVSRMVEANKLFKDALERWPGSASAFYDVKQQLGQVDTKDESESKIGSNPEGVI